MIIRLKLHKWHSNQEQICINYLPASASVQLRFLSPCPPPVILLVLESKKKKKKHRRMKCLIAVCLSVTRQGGGEGEREGERREWERERLLGLSILHLMVSGVRDSIDGESRLEVRDRAGRIDGAVRWHIKRNSTHCMILTLFDG